MGLLQIIAQSCTLADTQNCLLQESNWGWWGPEPCFFRCCVWPMEKGREKLLQSLKSRWLSFPVCFQVPYPLSNCILRSNAMPVSQCSHQELKSGIDLQLLLLVTVAILWLPAQDTGLCPDTSVFVRETLRRTRILHRKYCSRGFFPCFKLKIR